MSGLCGSLALVLLALVAVQAATPLQECAAFATVAPQKQELDAKLADCAVIIYNSCGFPSEPAECDAAQTFAGEFIALQLLAMEDSAETDKFEKAERAEAAAELNRANFLDALNARTLPHSLLETVAQKRTHRRHHELQGAAAGLGHNKAARTAKADASKLNSRLHRFMTLRGMAKGGHALETWPGGKIPYAFWGGGRVQLDGRNDLSVVQDTATHGEGAELLQDATAEEQQLAVEAMRQWELEVNRGRQAKLIEFIQVPFTAEGPKLLFIHNLAGGASITGFRDHRKSYISWGNPANGRTFTVCQFNKPASRGHPADTIGEAVHEIGHVLGLKHTHTRHDALHYVTNTGYTGNSGNHAKGKGLDWGVFDYGSIMTYSIRSGVIAALKNKAANENYFKGGLGQHTSETVANDDVRLQRWGGGINVHDVAMVREIYGWVLPQPQDCVCPTTQEYLDEIAKNNSAGNCWTHAKFTGKPTCLDYCQHTDAIAPAAGCWFDAMKPMSADMYPARAQPWVNAIAWANNFPARGGACRTPAQILLASPLDGSVGAVITSLSASKSCAEFLRDIAAYKADATPATRDAKGRAILATYIKLGSGKQVDVPNRDTLQRDVPLDTALDSAKDAFWTLTKFDAEVAPCTQATTLEAFAPKYATDLNCLW